MGDAEEEEDYDFGRSRGHQGLVLASDDEMEQVPAFDEGEVDISD